MKLIGIVMCGGQSARMGTDKGLLLQNNKTWASMAAQKLKPYVTEVYFSVNINQVNRYSEVFETSKLIHDCLDIQGPLCGLLSVHQKLNPNDLLIMACDMIDLKPQTIKNLVEHFEKSEKNKASLVPSPSDSVQQKYFPVRVGLSEAFVYKNNTEIEPLFGIYTSKGLNKILDLANQNKLQKHSMKYTLALLDTTEILIQDSQLAEFKNYNTPNDIVL